jgi:outer membrane protein OmpA-like peptidoglycan-associated protein
VKTVSVHPRAALLAALCALVAGCATPPPAPPPVAPPAAPAPVPAPPPVSVIDGFAWTPQMVVISQTAEDVARGTPMQVARTTDNRVLVRVTGDAAFEPGRAALNEHFRRFLDGLTASLAGQPDVTVLILGHTDSVGSETLNQRISEERANATKDYLIARGVAFERITAQGRGEREPVADNASAEGRALNRRVELLIAHPAAR